jgi:hypothetical protein
LPKDTVYIGDIIYPFPTLIMSPEDYRLLVYVANEQVRNIAITAIAYAAVAAPDSAYPNLHRVVIRTKAPSESVFFFKDKNKAEEAVANILEARESVDQCRIGLYADVNQHLLHPDQRD